MFPMSLSGELHSRFMSRSFLCVFRIYQGAELLFLTVSKLISAAIKARTRCCLFWLFRWCLATFASIFQVSSCFDWQRSCCCSNSPRPELADQGCKSRERQSRLVCVAMLMALFLGRFRARSLSISRGFVFDSFRRPQRQRSSLLTTVLS